jgi:chromosomal replication initiation ATPase DnaA
MKEQKSSVDFSAEPGVEAIQWTIARLFEVSLHDLIFGSTTLKINDYPRQLALARIAALYLCRKRTRLGPTVIARAFNRGPSAVSYAVRSIERLLTEEPLGDLPKRKTRSLVVRVDADPQNQKIPGERILDAPFSFIGSV